MRTMLAIAPLPTTWHEVIFLQEFSKCYFWDMVCLENPKPKTYLTLPGLEVCHNPLVPPFYLTSSSWSPLQNEQSVWHGEGGGIADYIHYILVVECERNPFGANIVEFRNMLLYWIFTYKNSLQINCCWFIIQDWLPNKLTTSVTVWPQMHLAQYLGMENDSQQMNE